MITGDPTSTIRSHLELLGHVGFGVTELRVFKSSMGPMVAYADSPDNAVRLCLPVDGKTPRVDIGVQPRLLYLYECAPVRVVHGLSARVLSVNHKPCPCAARAECVSVSTNSELSGQSTNVSGNPLPSFSQIGENHESQSQKTKTP